MLIERYFLIPTPNKNNQIPIKKVNQYVDKNDRQILWPTRSTNMWNYLISWLTELKWKMIDSSIDRHTNRSKWINWSTKESVEILHEMERTEAIHWKSRSPKMFDKSWSAKSNRQKLIDTADRQKLFYKSWSTKTVRQKLFDKNWSAKNWSTKTDRQNLIDKIWSTGSTYLSITTGSDGVSLRFPQDFFSQQRLK
jgi:hypothetical protein